MSNIPKAKKDKSIERHSIESVATPLLTTYLNRYICTYTEGSIAVFNLSYLVDPTSLVEVTYLIIYLIYL